jgi:hypothetical protein
MNRWQEDWSALSDPALHTQPLDELKYIPLSEDSSTRYLSFGLTHFSTPDRIAPPNSNAAG